MPPLATEGRPVLAGPIPVRGPVADVAALKPAQITRAEASDMSPMSPGGLVQVQEGGPFIGGGDANISSAQADQPSQGKDLLIPPSFSAAENCPGPAVQQDAP